MTSCFYLQSPAYSLLARSWLALNCRDARKGTDSWTKETNRRTDAEPRCGSHKTHIRIRRTACTTHNQRFGGAKPSVSGHQHLLESCWMAAARRGCEETIGRRAPSVLQPGTKATYSGSERDRPQPSTHMDAKKLAAEQGRRLRGGMTSDQGRDGDSE